MSTLKNWTRVADADALAHKGRLVVRTDGKQIALFETGDGLFACNNRCPHEGYPLSEGSLDNGCLLTCHWHNWKFDLATGKSAYGGDALRTYPVAVRDGGIWLDLTDPPIEARRAVVLKNMRDAFDDNAYARLAREVARWQLTGKPATEAVAAAIGWAYDRYEFGMTHAFAGTADWLTLYHRHADDAETRLVCAIEAIGHMADDALREPPYPFHEGQTPYNEDAFVAAVEREDQEAAVALVRGGLAEGLRFDGFERGLSRAALAHYADFGHSLIYVVKAGELIAQLGEAVAEPVLLSLVRGIVFGRREDQIPEFRGYAPALANWGAGDATAPDPEDYRGRNINRALELTVAHSKAAPEALFQALLAANAWNLLTYDESYQDRTDQKIADNVGWLDFTHGITFANAVRQTCTRYPELWPAGLLQMACFAGRNAPYTDNAVEIDRWQVEDASAFFADAEAKLFDHGQGEYIISVHLVKTTLAVQAESQGAAGPLLLAALNRFLNARIKRRHSRRTAQQALAFVALDG